MRLPDEILQDLAAAMDMAGRDASAAWLRVVASALEGCARDIREFADKNPEITVGRAPAAFRPSLSQQP